MLDIGDRFPDFELHDDRGNPLSSKELRGRPSIIYFYPKDDTPGCTMEACSFRDTNEEFTRTGIRVIGVSPDSVSSHAQFKKKYDLNFSLLADPEKKLCIGAGVLTPDGKLDRSTFILDREGIIRWAHRSVKAEGHIEQVKEACAALRLFHNE